MHFKPEDFERDFRNEMLGLPLRNLLKPGSCPMTLEESKSQVSVPVEAAVGKEQVHGEPPPHDDVAENLDDSIPE